VCGCGSQRQDFGMSRGVTESFTFIATNTDNHTGFINDHSANGDI
jgi:hypothetical protein